MKNKHNGGFSLIETLVAIAVLGIFVVPTCNAILTSFRMNQTSDELLQAQLAVSSAVESVMAEGIQNNRMCPLRNDQHENYGWSMGDPADTGDDADLYPDVSIYLDVCETCQCNRVDPCTEPEVACASCNHVCLCSEDQLYYKLTFTSVETPSVTVTTQIRTEPDPTDPTGGSSQ